MTAPRDARGGDASLSGDARAERDAGDTNDELAGEDAQLRAMRSVWLSMREEEPSSGGLSELMAAARGKAVEMAPRPTWWQRTLAALRRPPVLAFATTLLLLGGAVVVSQHVERKGGDADLALETARAPVAAATRPVVTATTDEPTPGGAQEADPSATPSEARAASARPAAAPDSSSMREKAESKESGNAPVAASPREPAVQPASPPPPSARTNDERNEDRVGGTGESQTLSDRVAGAPAATHDTSGAATATPAPVKVLPSDAQPSSPAAAGDTDQLERVAPAHLAKPQPGHVGSAPLALYRKCEAAAARGDCAEARRLVEQISTTDHAYRARIGKTSRIAKCLAE